MLHYKRKAGVNMLSTKTIRLCKTLNVKEYLKNKNKTEKYEQYINFVIQRAQKSISMGHCRPLNCLIEDVYEKFGMMPK